MRPPPVLRESSPTESCLVHVNQLEGLTHEARIDLPLWPDLLRHLLRHVQYAAYGRRAPMLVPFMKRRHPPVGRATLNG